MPEGSTPEVVTPPVKPKVASQQLRTFSKENYLEERNALAASIRAKRGEHFQAKKALISRQGEIPSKKAELDVELGTNLEKLAQTEEVLDELSPSWYSRSLHYFERKKLDTQLKGLQSSKRQTERDLDLLRQEEQRVEKRLAEPGRNYHFEDARRLLEDFYKGEKKKWEKAPYSKEDIKRYFSEEHLSSLSVEEYEELMNRFGWKMVYHATRQGIRDHLGHMYHTAGKDEFQNEFEKILEDGHLRSALGIYLKDGVRREAIMQFLQRTGGAQTKDKALEMLDGIRQRFSDINAVHVTVGMVASGDYGAEKGNEIFFAFPSQFIASNYYFGGTVWLDSLGSQWNDQWILSSDESAGININAGLVYIPKDVKVSPNTGSKYELDEDKKLIIDKQNVDSVKAVILDKDFIELITKINDASMNRSAGNLAGRLEELKINQSNRFNLSDELFNALFHVDDRYNNSGAGLKYLYDDLEKISDPVKREEHIDEYIKGFLKNTGNLYLKAQNPITAQQYWENYFDQHPGKRPNKIVWYSGSPSQEASREDFTSIYSQFPENAGSPPNLGEREGRFLQVAREAIEEHFPEEAKIASQV